MGRSRYKIYDETAPYFLTCTVLNWMPLFTRPQTTDIILEALRHRQEQDEWKIYGYVILENHIHMIAPCLSGCFPTLLHVVVRL